MNQTKTLEQFVQTPNEMDLYREVMRLREFLTEIHEINSRKDLSTDFARSMSKFLSSKALGLEGADV